MGSYPISFAIPEKKWFKYKSLRKSNSKTFEFSHILPGKTSYQYTKENEYIEHYSSCMFAITCRKGGWESLRHYEILIAGALPYFLHVEHIPEKDLCIFPKQLLKKVIELPGMPSQKEVRKNMTENQNIKIDKSLFDMEKYNSLRTEFLEYASNNMLCKHMVKNMLQLCNLIPSRTSRRRAGCRHRNRLSGSSISLFAIHSKQIRGPQDYQRDLICIGLLESGYTLYTTFDISFLFDDFPVQSDTPNPKGVHGEPIQYLENMYGCGFTYGHSLDVKYKKNWILTSLEQIPKECIVIIHTKSNQSFPNDWMKLENKKIFVDGNDDWFGLRTERYSPDENYPIFVREITPINKNRNRQDAELYWKYLTTGIDLPEHKLNNLFNN